jgi:Na+-translocating ferredoxin:NAD+ oxidoreductase RnfG subunit
MTRICNKRAQAGVGISLVAATLAIALIIVLFALVSTLFIAKSGVQEKTVHFSAKLQSETSLLALLNSKSENLTLTDMLRISRINSAYEEKAKSLILSMNNVYKSWAFSQVSGISAGVGTVASQQGIAQMEIPDFRGNIKILLGVSDEQ